MLGEGGMTDNIAGELETKSLVRLALERAAVRIEQKSGNKVYMSAWKIAAKIVRDMKPD